MEGLSLTLLAKRNISLSNYCRKSLLSTLIVWLKTLHPKSIDKERKRTKVSDNGKEMNASKRKISKL